MEKAWPKNNNDFNWMILNKKNEFLNNVKSNEILENI